MRTSNYVHYVTLPESTSYYVIHGYTGAMDKVAPDVVRYLLEHRGEILGTHTKDEKIAWDSVAGKAHGEVTSETIESLIARGYLTDKSVDEEREYVVRLTHRFHDIAINRQRPGFLIIPTYECNLRCPYCFETETRIDLNKEGRLLTVMSPEMADAAFQTIEIMVRRKLRPNQTYEDALSRLRITLYGGEPLMRPTLPIVDYIVKRGRALGMNFYAITNGVELQDFEHLLGPDGISGMQITLDGPEEIHDVNRLGPRYRHTYFTIMDNFELAVRRGAKVSVRVHTDWKSIGRTSEITGELARRGLLDSPNLSVYTVPRHKWHVGEQFPMYPNMAMHEVKQKLVQLSQSGENGAEIRKVGVPDENTIDKLATYMRGGIAALSNKVEYCSANTGGMNILDPFGAIYSCWDTVGHEAEKIGTYSVEGPVFNQRAEDWISRCPGDIPQCSNCKYVMFHFGGCAGLPVEMGFGLLHPACYAFQDVFMLNTKRFFAEDLFKKVRPLDLETVDSPMDLAASAAN